MRAIVETELRRLGLRPRDLNVVAELGLQESSQTAVEEGLGATFTSLAAIERELELGRMTAARVDRLEPAPRLRRRAPGRARAVAPRRRVRGVLPRGLTPGSLRRRASSLRLSDGSASPGDGARSAPCRAGATTCGARGTCGRRRAGSRGWQRPRGRTALPAHAPRAVLQLDVLAVHREALVEAAELVEHRPPHEQAGAEHPIALQGASGSPEVVAPLRGLHVPQGGAAARAGRASRRASGSAGVSAAAHRRARAVAGPRCRSARAPRRARRAGRRSPDSNTSSQV